METVLLTEPKMWEGALTVLQREMLAAGGPDKRSDREDLNSIVRVLQLSERGNRSDANFMGMELAEREREKLNKAYEDYKKRRQKTQA